VERVKVLKALKDGHKLYTVFGLFSLDKRQTVIFLGTVVALMLFYEHLSSEIGLNAKQSLVLFGPLVALSVLFAFGRIDGKAIDYWGQHKLESLLKPRALRWRRAPKGGRDVRDSVQAALPTERFLWEMLRTVDGTYLIALEVEPFNLSLSSHSQRRRAEAKVRELYNRIDFPIQEVTASRGGDLSRHSRDLLSAVRDELEPGQTRLANYARQRLRFYEQVVPGAGARRRSCYLVLPHRPNRPRKGFSLLSNPRAGDARELQREAREALATLRLRVDVVREGLEAVSLRARVLTNGELQGVVKGETTGEDSPEPVAEAVPRAKGSSPIALESGRLKELSEPRFGRLLEAAEEERGEEPPAVGTGDLTVSDRIAPGAVRIFDDCLKVDGVWHRTVFVYDYPDELHFGVLTGLANRNGRVKLVKHVEPQGREKAQRILGRAFAELKASERTADDGDVISKRERELARDSADAGLVRLMTGQENFFGVGLYVHCEADSREELERLVKSVRGELASHGIRTKPATLESWNGFLSCLPLGLDLLDSRYAKKGLLTDALACLFSYGTHRIDHDGGVLLGQDKSTGSLVHLNTRLLPNPHAIVLGTTGAGKSQTCKLYSAELRLRGERVVVIDPEGNSVYGRVAEALDGSYVRFGHGSRDRFNPCDLPRGYVNLGFFRGETADEDEERARLRAARAAAFDGKKVALTRLVSLMIGGSEREEGLTVEQASRVEALWDEVYRGKGITEDPDTHDNEPPTFRDFFRLLAEEEDLEGVRRKLYSWEHGSLRHFFDSRTNVDLDNKYLVFHVSGVKGRERAALEFALLDSLNATLSDPAERSTLVVEELWSPLKYRQSSDFVEEFWRSGRARSNAMVGATQHPEEFVGSEVGRVILDLSATQLLMLQEPKGADLVKDLYHFSDEEADRLQLFTEGEGYLVVGRNRVPLRVLCSPYEMRLFNTDPDKEREYRREEKQALAAGKTAALGAPVDEKRLEPPDAETRELTASAEIRKLLSEADDGARPFVPEEEDYVPPEPATRDDEPSDPHLPTPTGGAAPLYAFFGPTAGRVAYHLAGLLARSGKDAGRRVLLVDAEGFVSRRVLSEITQGSPDDFVAGGLEGPLDDHVARDTGSGLSVLFAPRDGNLPAGGLVERVREDFDAIVAVCDTSLYARDWLEAATAAVATAADARSLDGALKQVEALRGRNGTLVAPMGPPGARGGEIPRAVFGLPANEEPAFAAAEGSGGFATLLDDGVRRRFAPLAEALLRKRDERAEEVRAR